MGVASCYIGRVKPLRAHDAQTRLALLSIVGLCDVGLLAVLIAGGGGAPAPRKVALPSAPPAEAKDVRVPAPPAIEADPFVAPFDVVRAGTLAALSEGDVTKAGGIVESFRFKVAAKRDEAWIDRASRLERLVETARASAFAKGLAELAAHAAGGRWGPALEVYRALAATAGTSWRAPLFRAYVSLAIEAERSGSSAAQGLVDELSAEEILSLGSLRTDDEQKLMVLVLKRGGDVQCYTAIHALAVSQATLTDEVLLQIGQLLKSRKNEELVLKAKIAMHAIGARAVPVLLPLLADEARAVDAAIVLGLIGPPALPGLLAALRGMGIVARRAAAVGLARMGPDAAPAIADLEDASDDDDTVLARLARDALVQIRGGR